MLFEFLRAAQAKDVDGLIAQARLMTQGGRKIPKPTEALAADLRQALERENISDQMIAVFTALVEAGFDFHRRYSWGAMKGLLILYGETYVDNDLFLGMLLDAARFLFLKKRPLKIRRR